ncbi:hypothetical protein [Bythopirellula polymerisocia]|uniref:Uncharacterized protein n=1 Tax=Bythopirellula polymerisocia TaxID=2528003 RepID=A0A5C6D0M0_9BACT|nr:hypothetical protein [Bythopirellula polymerisocia]TWU29291.1 hypothetical protein Pla144_00670 [Bythopirellula polymerisocia]
MSVSEPLQSPLAREEYVEQTHFFTVLAERMTENIPAQEVLAAVREEVLATTKMPMAIDFLLAELRHQGEFAAGMRKLSHYFTPFQCYVMSEAENVRKRFDLRIGLLVLAREAMYRGSEHATRQGLFVYQFETLCRNRLGYDDGLEAMSRDPSYDATWSEWLLTVRRQVGLVEFADLIYVRSEFYRVQAEREERAGTSQTPIVLFGLQEGRIAWANRRKEPLLLFSALHRHLDYPAVPRPEPANPEERLLPVLARRVEQLEARLRLVEEEQRGGIDLSKFYAANQPKMP